MALFRQSRFVPLQQNVYRRTNELPEPMYTYDNKNHRSKRTMVAMVAIVDEYPQSSSSQRIVELPNSSFP